MGQGQSIWAGTTVQTERGSYWPGETIRGQIIVDAKENLDLHSVRLRVVGQEFVRWHEDKFKEHDRDDDVHSTHESDTGLIPYQFVSSFLRVDAPVMGNGSFQQGAHVIQFEFKLPETMPASFKHIEELMESTREPNPYFYSLKHGMIEYSDDPKRGHPMYPREKTFETQASASIPTIFGSRVHRHAEFGIQYYLRAACLKEDTKEVVRSLNVPFTVIQPYTPVPSAGPATDKDTQPVVACCCMDKGKVTASITLPQSVGEIGNKAAIQVDVDNKSSLPIKFIVVNLKGKHIVTTKDREDMGKCEYGKPPHNGQPLTFGRIICQKAIPSGAKFGPGSGGSTQLDFEIDPKLAPTFTSDLMKIQYFLEVGVRASWGTKVVAQVPVTIAFGPPAGGPTPMDPNAPISYTHPSMTIPAGFSPTVHPPALLDVTNPAFNSSHEDEKEDDIFEVRRKEQVMAEFKQNNPLLAAMM